MLQQYSSKIKIVLNFPEYHQNKLKLTAYFKIFCYTNIHGCEGKHRIECEWSKLRSNTCTSFYKCGVIWAIVIVTDVAVHGPLHFVFRSSLFGLHRFNVVASLSSLNPWCVFFFSFFFYFVSPFLIPVVSFCW